MAPAGTALALAWREEGDTLVASDAAGVVFRDSLDHWTNGVLRLLDVDDAGGRAWVERVAAAAQTAHGRPLHQLDPEERLTTLAAVSHTAAAGDGLLDAAEDFDGVTPDTVWTAAVREDDALAVVGSQQKRLGWLVERASGERPSPERVVEYEDDYFQGQRADVGYGDYGRQQPWREEKARRQVRELRGAALLAAVELPSRPRVLDVGAGFGFFRAAAAEAGWEHAGVEVSAFANRASEELYGFTSFRGSLEEYVATEPGSFELVTLWDVLEHVPDPVGLLRMAHSLLRERGLVAVRTPNLDAAERTVFGDRYHSFKAEHLVYFAGPSLARALHRAGFAVAACSSQSHLLSGFLGSYTTVLATTLRGSDLVAVGLRTEPSK